MASIADLNAQVATLSTTATATDQKVDALLVIAHQPPPPATQADLDALSTSVAGVQAQLDATNAKS